MDEVSLQPYFWRKFLLQQVCGWHPGEARQSRCAWWEPTTLDRTSYWRRRAPSCVPALPTPVVRSSETLLFGICPGIPASLYHRSWVRKQSLGYFPRVREKQGLCPGLLAHFSASSYLHFSSPSNQPFSHLDQRRLQGHLMQT